MMTAAHVLIGILGVLHFWFLVLEMFLWQKPKGLKTFNLTPEVAASSAALAANQGLYNGFLGAGLFWSLTLQQNAVETQYFFLICVLLAGIYGGLTAVRKVLYVQALPAAIALGLLFFG